MEAAARTLGLRLQFLEASNDRECEMAFARIAEMRTALLIATDAFFAGRRERLGALAARYAVPAIYVDREFIAGDSYSIADITTLCMIDSHARWISGFNRNRSTCRDGIATCRHGRAPRHNQ